MYDRPFRWWVQSVMPVVFDDSLSYYEVLAKLTKYIEGLTGDVDQIEKILETIEGIEDVTQFTEMLENIQKEIGNLSNLSTQSKSDLVSAINEVALKADIAYWKPASGIPESDLNQSVQDKLNKTGEATKYIINNKTLKAAPSNNSLNELGIGTYTVPSGGIPWDTLSQDVRDRINAGGSGTGGTTDYTDLNNKPQINGHTLNAGNNTAENLGLGTYSKPSDGIPESDLSAEVQEKLNTSGGIADNQENFVASRDYEAGELVYINDVLYKTKYKILNGTTMVPGNNIEVTDISTELEKINSDIDSLQSGAGPNSWSLSYDITIEYNDSSFHNFFEYVNCIGGENYLFIVTPTINTTYDRGYVIYCRKRNGTIVFTRTADDAIEYENQYRFTFTPEETGEYYFDVRLYSGGGITSRGAKLKIILEYTESQGISELWSKVNEAIAIGEDIPALKQLTATHTQELAGLDGIPERVSTLENEYQNLEEIPKRVENLEEECDIVNGLLNENLFIEKTASGELIAIPLCVKNKPKELSVTIPYQSSGISSFTMRHRRRNMLDLNGNATYAGIDYTVLEDKTLRINGTASGNSRYGVFGDTRAVNTRNVYNLPNGVYTIYFYDTKNNAYQSQWYVYENTGTTLIYNVPVGPETQFETTADKDARVCCQFQNGYAVDAIVKCFMGAGISSLSEWDEPVDTHHEIDVNLGRVIYGGTVDVVNGKLYSTYNSDGSIKDTPEEFDINVDVPIMYSGFNTIWSSVPDANITITYQENTNSTEELEKEVDENRKTIKKLNDEYIANYFPISMFPKMGVIGDSYASGSLYNNEGVYVDTINEISWGKNIERMYGIDVTLFSKGGLSTRTWLTDNKGLTALESDTVKDLYWFGLGINDVSIYASDNSYLGTISDISNHEQGTDWATTFYGNVGRIIEAVKAKAPKAIIVMSSFGPGNYNDGARMLNSALRYIAEYYNIPYVNQEEDSFYMLDLYNTCKRGNHPTAMLYAGMANANVRLLGKCIYNNPDMFVGFIPDY